MPLNGYSTNAACITPGFGTPCMLRFAGILGSLRQGVRLPPTACCTGDDSRARPPRLQMKQRKLSVTSNINNQAHKHDIARGQAASIIVNYAPPLLTSIA